MHGDVHFDAGTHAQTMQIRRKVSVENDVDRGGVSVEAGESGTEMKRLRDASHIEELFDLWQPWALGAPCLLERLRSLARHAVNAFPFVPGRPCVVTDRRS